jgi:hypothetical protein
MTAPKTHVIVSLAPALQQLKDLLAHENLEPEFHSSVINLLASVHFLDKSQWDSDSSIECARDYIGNVTALAPDAIANVQRAVSETIARCLIEVIPNIGGNTCAPKRYKALGDDAIVIEFEAFKF